MEKLLMEIGFDRAEAQFFSNLYIRLDKNDQNLLRDLGTEFSSGIAIDNSDVFEGKIRPLASKYNVDPMCLNMLFFLCNLDKMRQNFIKKNISEEIFYNTARDFKYKLDECKKMLGFLGTRTFRWYYHFLNADMVALGRFQFHRKKFFDDLSYKWKDITINPGDPIVNIHIPSSGSMPREARMDSYKKAFEHFGKNKGDYLVLTCRSWLLYTNYKDVFVKGGNMYDFMEDFDIISSTREENDVFSASWSIFGCDYNEDMSKLPTDTSLQRNFISYLKKEKNTGWGTGVILFDGEKIVNNKRDN